MCLLIGLFVDKELWANFERYVQDYREIGRAMLAMLPLGHPAPGVTQQLLRHLWTVHTALELVNAQEPDEIFAELLSPRPECIWLLRMLGPTHP